MNQTALLRIIERLERLLAKLPEKIRRPVLRELTPLKELFLKQRPPRFLFVGSSGTPMQQIINLLFPQEPGTPVNVSLVPVHRWTDWSITGHGTISILDGREAAESAEIQIEEDLKRQSADVIFFFDDAQSDLQRLVATNTATRVGQE